MGRRRKTPEQIALAGVVGAELHRIRVGASLTVQQLVQRSGICRAEIMAVEAGDRTPGIDVGYRWARACGESFVTVAAAIEAARCAAEAEAAA